MQLHRDEDITCVCSKEVATALILVLPPRETYESKRAESVLPSITYNAELQTLYMRGGLVSRGAGINGKIANLYSLQTLLQIRK